MRFDSRYASLFFHWKVHEIEHEASTWKYKKLRYGQYVMGRDGVGEILRLRCRSHGAMSEREGEEELGVRERNLVMQ